MQRYFALSKKDDFLELKCDDLHHIFNVLRLNKSDQVEIIFGDEIFTSNVEVYDKVYFKYLNSRKIVDLCYKITFLLANPKSDKLELVIQKLIEICNANFIIYNSKRSVAKMDKHKFNNRKKRYDSIIKEACEQSKHERIANISFVEKIEEIDFKVFDLKLVAYEKEQLSNKLNYDLVNKKNNIIVAVGPEGGFEINEIEKFISYGFKSISLGKYILRCETAPIYIGSVLSFLKEN